MTKKIATTKAVIIATVNCADSYHQHFKFKGWTFLLINNIIKAIYFCPISVLVNQHAVRKLQLFNSSTMLVSITPQSQHYNYKYNSVRLYKSWQFASTIQKLYWDTTQHITSNMVAIIVIMTYLLIRKLND